MGRLSFALIAAICSTMALLLVAGCGGGGDRPTTTGAAATTPAAAVTVWFSDGDGDLVAESHPVPAGLDPLNAALAALIAGPRDPALLAALPPATRLLAVRERDGVAHVDLSTEFERDYPSGGAAAELALVAPLVRTIVGVGTADRVLVTVAGRVPQPVGSQLDFGAPLTPADLGL